MLPSLPRIPSHLSLALLLPLLALVAWACNSGAWVPRDPPCSAPAAELLNPDDCISADDDTTAHDDDTGDDDGTPDDDSTSSDDDDTTSSYDFCPDENFHTGFPLDDGPCNDNQDNDGDNFCDGHDPDCIGGEVGVASKAGESDQIYAGSLPCYNGYDDDLDGLDDGYDPDCWIDGVLPSGYLDCRELLGYDPDVECAAVW